MKYNISLEDYKEDLVNHYVYEIDNDTKKLEERKEELKKHYSDEYLNDIIKGTINVIDKILEKDNDTFWEEELRGYGKHIFLNICGGFGSDRIVKTVNNNLVSLWLMRKTFGEKFDVYIDRCYYNQTFGDMGVEYVMYFLSVSGPLKTLKELKENPKIKKKSKNYRQCLTK